ncbi:MAG: aspartate-semialdehyde dehydrogenase [Acidobacteria bacterium 13_1_40CM_2_68_5]|nr:MAG: aspartate-semialdehyde dehydrogenase [Acidobacteria bacterium 13_1_40CM_2_68_5]OLE66795.1 MAG: aspartate-semialdehyde dehydrogenase [Acidobacteria bacterium 13_1_20CM_2_68_7]
MPVAVLGATGAVGQRFVQLLDGHPWFRAGALAASERSAGRRYGQAARWFLEEPMPEWARDMEVVPCRPGLGARVAFSGLDASVAGAIEEEFARAGHAVVSNSRNHRMDPEVPLLIPEVNADHLELVEVQKRRWRGSGFIVTNPNCSTVGLAMSAAPLYRAFGIKRLVVATLQAISGAGYPGVSSVDILDNVIPFIGGEEEKMESETLKILGTPKAAASFPISAQCHRVQVSDGHTLAVAVETDQRTTPEEAARALREFRSSLAQLGLPSLPERPLTVRDEPDRPQPRFDRMAGKGMTVSVGRMRVCPVLGLKYVALVHNTIRGAAGVAILNAELLKAKGCL